MSTKDRCKEHIDLIYKHAHKDFKGMLGGKKSVMYWDNGTTYGPIESMPELQYKQLLKSALSRHYKVNVKGVK